MSDQFGKYAESWKSYLQTPWGKLQNSVRRHNLAKHLPPPPIHILDAGSGNGAETLPLAQTGYQLTWLDASETLLADGSQLASDAGVSEQISIKVGSVEQLRQLFAATSFDAILLHNVIQYVPEGTLPALFDDFRQLLKPNGFLSLVTVNRFSEPFRHAISHHDLAKASDAIGAKSAYSAVFDHTIRVYDADDMSQLLAKAGFKIAAHYGVRLLIDYIQKDELKFNPQSYRQLEQLEIALSDQFPYKHLARSFQLIATI